VKGTYAGIGGAGGACEDEDAFALNVEPLHWKVQGAGSTSPRPDTPSGCGNKNVGRAHGAQIERLEPHRAHVGAKGRTVCTFASDNVRISSEVLQRSTSV